MFNTISYIILFPIAVLIYYLIPKKAGYIWLLAVSFAFYWSRSGSFTLLLALSVIITYTTGVGIYYADSRRLKNFVLAVAVAILIGTLFVFKYLDFTLGLVGSPVRIDLVLPLGISFYTFQAVSYITDVYRGQTEPERNILKLGLFLSFFLSIVSGPINRAGDIIPQITSADRFSADRAKRGMQKMLWGYFLKLAIAGRLAIVVENVYSDPGVHSGFELAIAAVFYMFMLYCDFEGYSQIAIGSGYILGIEMKENFCQPFLAQSMSEVWRRWHVSLSTWFRDYMYIPLGGSRRGTVRKYINIFVVLFVSGIWHGANLTFFIWGALNGIFNVAGQMLLPARDRLSDMISKKVCKTIRAREVFERVRVFFKRLGVYILFSYTFIYFANDSVTKAYLAVKGIITRFSLSDAGQIVTLGLGKGNLALVLAMMAFVLVADGEANKRGCDTPALITRIPTFWRWTIYYVLLTAILFSANLTGKEFIYSKM
ncbi:MAG: MBOAT family protein [Lachnospiraceae bacterium]|nr:MBOAT family protein [Lachnospiraceae bacterium]